MICKKCKQDVDATLTVCPNCGELLGGDSSTEETTNPVDEIFGTAGDAGALETDTAEKVSVTEDSTGESSVEEAPTFEESTETVETDAPTAVPVYSPGNIVPPVKKKTAVGLIIGLVAGGVVLLAAILFGIYFFFLNGNGIMDLFGSGGTEGVLDATNNSANNSLFVKAGNDYYCNLVVATSTETTGIYKVSLNGKRKEQVLEGTFQNIAAVGQYIVAYSENEAGQMSTVVIDTKAKDKEPEQISSARIANLRVYGDWCYYQELSEDNIPTSIKRYNPLTKKSEAVYEKQTANFSVNGDTLVFITYDESTQLCTLYTYNVVTKAEPVSLGKYSMLGLPMQLTEDHIYFIQAEAEATKGTISRIPYAGGEAETVYTFDLNISSAQYLVDDKGIFFSSFTADQTTGIPSVGVVLQLDINGKNPVEVSSEIWMSTSRIAGNIFYLKFDSATQSYAFYSRPGGGKNTNALFDTAADSSGNQSSQGTDSTPSSSAAPLEPVSDTKLHEDYDPKIQLAEPKKGEEIAVLTTSLGVIKIRFFEKQAPKAVENFKGLAKKGYYDGLTFHRVSKGFMVQSGDPKGDGTGGESFWGEPFEDEFNKDLLNIRGALAMANSGPNTNGSQFFINQTTAEDLKAQIQSWDEWATGLDLQEAQYGARNPYQPKRIPDSVRKQYDTLGGTPILDGAYQNEAGRGHTVFGQVIEGMDIVDKIASVEVEMTTDPTTGTEVPGEKPKVDVKIEKVEIKKY